MTLYGKVQTVLFEPDICYLGILIQFCAYCEKLTQIRKSSIYDLIYLKIPEKYNYKDYSLGLDGNSGVGLKIILDDYKFENSEIE